MIPGAVEALVVGAGHLGEPGQERGAREHALGLVGVQPHLLPLVHRQRTRLLPDAGVDGDAPEVVDERGPPRIGRLQPASHRRARRQLGHPGGVPGQPGRDEIGEVAHRRQGAIDPVLGEGERPAWLGRERGVPDGRALVVREDLPRPVGERGDDAGVECAPRPLADHAHGGVDPADHPVERRVAGDVHDPHGERDLLASEPVRLALAVPALGERPEQRLHRGRQAEAQREHLRHLAQRHEMALRLPRRERQAPRDLDRADRRRSVGLRQRAHEPAEELDPRAEHDRHVLAVQVAAEDHRGVLGVRGAADVEEQARVVRVRRGLRVDAEALGEPHRDERALEPVLERQPDGEVRGERERRDHLCGAHPFRSTGRALGHAPTVRPGRS